MLTVAPSGMEKAHTFVETPMFLQELILKGMAALEEARLKFVSIVGACFFKRGSGFSFPNSNTSKL